MNAHSGSAFPADAAPALLTNHTPAPDGGQVTASQALPHGAAGADLARIMLRRAKAAAKDRPAHGKTKPHVRRPVRGDGRDPNPLGGVLKQLVVDHQWERGQAGGTLQNAWPRLVGEAQAAHWKADAYNEQTGILRIVCDTPAWAASLRLMTPEVIKNVNAQLDGSPLRGLDVQIRTGRTARERTTAATEPSSEAAPRPVLRKERGAEPNSEYRTTRAALREAAVRRAAAAPAPPQPTAGTWREPEQASPSLPDTPSPQALRAARNAETRARALAKARTERSERSNQPATYSYLYAS